MDGHFKKPMSANNDSNILLILVQGIDINTVFICKYDYSFQFHDPNSKKFLGTC